MQALSRGARRASVVAPRTFAANAAPVTATTPKTAFGWPPTLVAAELLPLSPSIPSAAAAPVRGEPTLATATAAVKGVDAGHAAFDAGLKELRSRHRAFNHPASGSAVHIEMARCMTPSHEACHAQEMRPSQALTDFAVAAARLRQAQPDLAALAFAMGRAGAGRTAQQGEPSELQHSALQFTARRGIRNRAQADCAVAELKTFFDRFADVLDAAETGTIGGTARG